LLPLPDSFAHILKLLFADMPVKRVSELIQHIPEPNPQDRSSIATVKPPPSKVPFLLIGLVALLYLSIAGYNVYI